MRVQICVPAYKGQINETLRKVIGECLYHNPEEWSYSAWSSQVDAEVSKNEAICPSNLQFPELPFVDWFVLIGADMEPTAIEINHLIEQAVQGRYDILGAVYKKNSQEDEYCVSVQGVKFEKRKLQGIIPVYTLGMGLVAVSHKVFATMPKPWFNTKWVLNQIAPTDRAFAKEDFTWNLVPEDQVFCEKARQLGFEVHCDFDTEIKHNTISIKESNKNMELIPYKPALET